MRGGGHQFVYIYIYDKNKNDTFDFLLNVVDEETTSAKKMIEVDPNQGDNGATAAVGGSHADAGIELK